MDLGGERVGFFPEVVPRACGLGIREVAHHFDQVGPEPGMEVQSCLDKALRWFLLEAEVVPETEGGAIDITAFEGTVNTLAAGHARLCRKVYSRGERTGSN
jgi:hypothetical protein